MKRQVASDHQHFFGRRRNGIKEMSALRVQVRVIGFTNRSALEVRNQNIRVSVLLPGSWRPIFQVAKRDSAASKAGSKRSLCDDRKEVLP